LSYQRPGPPMPPRRRKLSPTLIVLIVAGALLGGCSVVAVLGAAVRGVSVTTSTRQPYTPPSLSLSPPPTSLPPLPVPEITSESALPAIASAPPTTTTAITLPDLRGLDGATAREQLTALGIYAVGYEAVNGKSVFAKSLWQVVDQSPAPGTAINPHDGVALRVDRFPPTTQPQPTRQAEPQRQEDQATEEPEQQTPSHEPSLEAQPATNPRYDTCAEANAHGFGPYQRGVNPEYEWYQDRDGDGWDCER
jgi:hypothetical protein